MKKKRIIALLLSLCLLAIPVLSSCSSDEIIDAINSLDKNDISSIASDIKSIVDDHGGSLPSEDRPDNNGNNGNGNGNNGNGNNGNGNHGGNGPDGNSGSGNNGNSGNGNGNHGGGNGNGGSGSEEKPAPVEVVDSELGLVFTLSEDEKCYSVSALKSVKRESISIPAEYNGVPVYGISTNAFSGCVNLKSISIPSTIASIGGFAFFRCERLEKIYIPTNVQSVGAYAFDGCSSLSIYCEAEKQPKGWNSKWNPDNCPVEWGYSCEHQWEDPTCTNPYICSICGIKDGEPLGHTWKEPTCTEAGYCEICDEFGEEATGHHLVNGKCTSCDYEEEEEEPIGNNIAPLATITDKTDWWAFDASYLVDGDKSTATLTDVRSKRTELSFAWDKAYRVWGISFVVNGMGSAPGTEETFDKKTENSFDMYYVLIDNNGDVIYEEAVHVNGEERINIDLYHTVSEIQIKIENNWYLMPIFEIEVYGEESEACYHAWIDATCTMPKTCVLCGETEGEIADHSWSAATCTKPYTCKICGFEEGEALGHTGGKPTCNALAVCVACGETYGALAPHEWENGKCKNCLIERTVVTIDQIESITPSQEGKGTGNLDCLFDGEKITAGTFGDTGKEYYPNASGDVLTIVLKEATALQSAIVWTSGNYSFAKIVFYAADGREIYFQNFVYFGSNEEGPSTPIEISLSSEIPVKKIELIATQLKWEGSNIAGWTQKTSEIELFKQAHQWREATCQAPKTCILCGETEGEAAEHKWQPATCTVAKKCSVCNKTEGEANGHRFIPSTCTEKKMCIVCNMSTSHNLYGHVFLDGVCAVCGAEDEILVTYNYLSGTEIKKATQNPNGTYTLLTERLSTNNRTTFTLADGTEIEKEFYGWFDEEGNLYAPGITVSFEKSTKLYEAYGVTVFTAEDLLYGLTQAYIAGYSYIKLGADITIDKRVAINWSACLIDLNGHTLTTTAEKSAFDITRGSFVLLGDGKLVHAPAKYNSDASISTVSFVRHGYGDTEYPQLFWIGKGVKFTSPYCALYVKSVLLEKAPNIVIAGELDVNAIAYISPVTEKAICRITEDAEIKISHGLIIFDETETEGLRMYLVLEQGVGQGSEALEKGVFELSVEEGEITFSPIEK